MARHVTCMKEQGCVMFDCLVHLWEWLDPPPAAANTPTTMDNKKNAPATQQPIQQQHVPTHHVHPPPNSATHLHLHNHNHNPAVLSNRLNPSQPYQIQPNGIMHQLLMQSPSSYQSNLQQSSNSNPDARSPLLENQQDLYGTRQPPDYRHYGANDNYPYQKLDTRPDLPPSTHNINQDIMHAVPKGYNAEVYQDYMKRNPPKDSNQIYQNHQSTYQPNVSQYTNKPYLPYTNRIQPASSESNTELLRRQYNEIQQMKLRQQMRYQTEAQMQQQQTFAERQLLLQQIHGVQPPPNLQQSIYSDGHYKDSDRYNMLSQQSEREERYQVQSPASTYQSQPTKAGAGASGEMSPMKSSGESCSPSVKSPVSGESRRSSGGTQALRSPVAQRPAAAPVAMSGMLYKQGSDGLKVWRKRWFVLAEYCLFYYKSQDEEKLLGSVLLPSYRVSACTAEDRVLRKFAFKLEHTNMRTYVLAAPDQEHMIKWVKALTMAALMQDTRNPDEKRKQPERFRTSVEKEEAEETAGPTYANAPPKPRRSNDGYNSPASDIYDPNYDLLQKPASHYSQGTNQNRYTETNQNRYPESNQNQYAESNHNQYSESNKNRYPETNKNRYIEPNQNRYPETTHREPIISADNDNGDITPQYPQYYGTKRSYDPQALSLPLTNTSSDRLENTPHSHASPYRNDSQSTLYDNRARSYQQQQQRQQDQITNDERLTEQIYGRNQTQSLLYTKEKAESEMPREMDLQNRNYRNTESGNDHLQPRTKEIQNTVSDANLDANIYSRDNYAEKPNRVGNKAPSTERLPIERRTPDAYGRSAPVSAYCRGKTSDYEDVYPSYSGENEYGMSYSKPNSPPSIAEKKTIPPTPSYQSNKTTDYPNNYQQSSASHNQGFNGPSVLRRKKMQSSNPTTPSVQRPHSADFLEYESKNETLNQTMPPKSACEPPKQPQRPKSSLDINSYYDPSSDRYYSEESYAEKMRQSAQYLQQRGLSSKDFQVPLAKYTSGLAQKQLDSYAHNLNNNYESGYERPPAPKDNVSYSSRYSELEVLNSNWTLKEKSAHESQKEYETRTGSAMSDGSSMGVREVAAARAGAHAQDGFMRSASARLPAAAPAEEGKDGEKKVQQREESMKRLLEWKQRMLQSPLTRKSTPASISLARSLNQSRQAHHRASEQLKNKPSTYTNASYNSYSSDDEASVSMTGATVGPNAHTNQQPLAKKSFVGSNTSIGRSGRDNNIPVRAVSPRVRWVEDKSQDGVYGSQNFSNSQQNLSVGSAEESWATARSPSRQSQQPVRAVSPRVRRHTHGDDTDCLGSLSGLERQESLQRLEQLKLQLAELEQQYEKSKPLVHLVDNMVKLGSLYNRPAMPTATVDRLERNQRLRQKVLAEQAEEQRRWAAGEAGDVAAARARVSELWALERELAAEAATLHGLKADKELIETLLTGVRSKFGSLQLSEATVTPPAAGGARALEADLARVHALLAHNSKKLEATVADNARLERELLSLRRALHTHRHAPVTHTPTTALLEDEVARVQQLVSALQRQRQELSRAVRHLTHQSRALQTSTPLPPVPASLPAANQPLYAPGSAKRHIHTLWLETDLDSGECVEHGLDEEYEESVALTTAASGHYDPTAVQYDLTAGHYDVRGLYDTGHYDGSGGHYDGPEGHFEGENMQPLYVDTRAQHDITSPLTSDDGVHNGLGNLTNVEKQEIKTVRIVKRESERRQRDRERSIQPNTEWSSNITANLDHLLEEELAPNNYTGRSTSLPRAQPQYPRQEDYYKSRNQPPNYLQLSNVNVPCPAPSMELSPKFPSSPSLSNYDYSRDLSSLSSSYNRSYDYSGHDRTLSLSTQFLNSPTDSSRTLTNDPLSKTSSIGSITRNAELSPIFKSEAAKQIITEMSSDGQPKSGSSLHRRQVPKEKRRHYTAPHHLSAKTLSEMPSEYFSQDKMGRSLDDADMERALRAPPDVVRSALAPQRYAESTIDRLLLAPRKILIPERYIPERPPELSPEEQKKRMEKVESIKKMLSSTPSSEANKSPEGEERRQRQHLLQMNQILAKQVMEMSKIVAEKALEELPREDSDGSPDRSPDVELPIYQQRDNFFT